MSPQHLPPTVLGGGSSRRRGAPIGNSNGFKHSLYSSRVKKRTPSADDATVLKSLADEIALICVFTDSVFMLALSAPGR